MVPAPTPRDAAGARRTAAEAAEAELETDLPEEVTQEEIQRRLDLADDVHIEDLSEASLRRMVLQFERKVKVNQELRIKHSDEPDRFLKSEVDLDEEIKRFAGLATHPDLYPDFVKLNGHTVLIGLLNHVNTDIAVDVFEVLSELTDADVVAEVEAPDAFVNALYEAHLCQMAVDCLLRINEEASEEDAQAVTNCLTMVENLTGVSPADSCSRFAKTPRFLPWLIKRVRAPGDVDYNRVYASEILGIILQNSSSSREAMEKLEGVDKLLRGIAVYRKRDPVDSEESEFVQNMFDCLCSLMLLPHHQVAFGKLQGLELMIRMMREHVFSSSLALRLADHAMRHCPTNCEIFVDKLGLKVIFAMFMKKGPKQKAKSALREAEEHVTSIIQSLCRYCAGTSMARVLNKFTECKFEKLERLLEMHEEYARAVRQADLARSQGQMQKIDRELEVDEDEQLFLDRCDAGLFTLQQVDLILVRLANMGNREASDEIGKLMDAKGVPLSEVCEKIGEYCTHLDDSANGERCQIQGFLKALAKRCGGDQAVRALQGIAGASAATLSSPERRPKACQRRPFEEVDSNEERASPSDGEEKPRAAPVVDDGGSKRGEAEGKLRLREDHDEPREKRARKEEKKDKKAKKEKAPRG